MTTTYTMRDLNAYVGDRVIVKAPPAWLADSVSWKLEYFVTPFVAHGGYPMMQDIPAGEYLIIEKIADSDEDGAGKTYVLRAA